jgi:broad specificity polyphosphatase/5'/3'-nucleotidase SurE
MTNSTTSLLNDNEISSFLVDYLEGRFSFAELQDKLTDHIVMNFDDTLEERNIQNVNVPENIAIQVHKEHVRHMLRKYLEEKISMRELSNWAAFIYMEPFYVPKGATEDERWQAGESATWDIIQKLAALKPAKFDSSIAREYLETL